MEKRTKKFYLGPEGIHYPYKCMAIFEDGKIRTVFLNQSPDTYFSHGGRSKVSGKSVRGFISIKEDGEMYFTAYKKKRHSIQSGNYGRGHYGGCRIRKHHRPD